MVALANDLIKRKEEIESLILQKEAILRSHNVGLKEVLVDAEGFPRSDVDLYAITGARNELASMDYQTQFN